MGRTTDDEYEYIVMVGNPSDGFTHYGPFDSFDDADEWCRGVSHDTWIVQLHSIG